MKKLFKWLLGIMAFVVILLVLAVILLPIVFDPNEHKPQIQQVMTDSIGREVALNGPIEWSVFPWVAINIKDVTIANEAGFKGDYLAQVKQVAVRVKLLPLLSQQIKIGQVELQQPQIKLQVAKSGNNNWQSLLNHLESNEGDNQANESPTDFEIRGIVISDGDLNYKDAQADLEIQLADMSFQSDVIKANTATAMSLQAQIELPALAMNGQLDMAWDATHLASEHLPIFNFKRMSFDGQSDGIAMALTTQGNTVMDLNQDTLNIDLLEFSYGVMQLTTPVVGQQISKNMSLSGLMEVSAFSVDELLQAMGSPLENAANNELSGSNRWSLANNRLFLSQIDFKLDDSEIKGQVDIKDLSQLRGVFDLSVNQLNIDDYLPNDVGQSSSASESDEAAMDLGQMSGQIKMDQLQAAGVKLSDITLNIKTQGQRITVEPMQAGFYQGLIRTELKLMPENETEKLQLTHAMQDFQAGGLLTDLIGTEYLTGLGQLNANIKIDQPFSDRPFKTANGSISYQLTDGDIVGIDVFQIMQQSLSLLNKSDAVDANSDLKTAFGLMEIQADVTDGILKTNTLKLSSPYFNLSGQVEIDLDQQTIKGTIKPMLTNIPEGILDKNFEKLLNIKIPVSLKGSLLEPDVSIDVAKLILESQKSKIDEKKEELKEDLFDALLGNKKDKKKKAAEETGNTDSQEEGGDQQPELTEKQKKKAEKDQLKKDLLEGLFKSSKDKDREDKKDEDDTGSRR